MKHVSKRSGKISAELFIAKAIEFKWLLISFILFLSLQIFHIAFVHWDKVAYIFGGKWFCGNQIYFEFLRPPLPSFLTCVFGAQDYSILITTAFACIVYFAAVLLLYINHKKKLNQGVFALFAFLFPAILFNFNFGSDLLAVAFLMLALAVKGPVKKGAFFALATLSRYNFLLFGLILFWHERKNPKRFGLMLALLVLLWIPWMIFNYLYTGNPFFSIYESSVLNVLNKGAAQPFAVEQIFILVLFVISLFAVNIKKILSNAKLQSGVLAALMFIFSAVKETRFMGILVPILAFNAAEASMRSPKIRLFFLLIFALAFVAAFFGIFTKPYFISEFNTPTDDFVKQCRVASDKWVFFYESGIVAECLADISSWEEFISDGGSIVLYERNGVDLSKFNVINRGEYVILKSDLCAPQPKKYISGSLRNNIYNWLSSTNSKIYDYSDWVK